MKNKIILFLFSVLILGNVFNAVAEDSNRVHFNINPENRQIMIPVHLNDSITANMTFDTATQNGCFTIDSSFLASHPSCLTLSILTTKTMDGSAWSSDFVPCLKYRNSQPVEIGNTDLIYNDIGITNWKKVIKVGSDGIFNIPQK